MGPNYSPVNMRGSASSIIQIDKSAYYSIEGTDILLANNDKDCNKIFRGWYWYSSSNYYTNKPEFAWSGPYVTISEALQNAELRS